MSQDYPRINIDPADMQELPLNLTNSKVPSFSHITESIVLVHEDGLFRPANEASTDDSRALEAAKRSLKVSFASISDPDIRHLDFNIPSHKRLLEKSFTSAFENARMLVSLWGASASLAVVGALWIYAAVNSQERYLQPGIAAAYRLFVTLALVGDICVGRRGIPALIFHTGALVTAMIASQDDDNLTNSAVLIPSDWLNLVAARAAFAFAGSLFSLWAVVGTLIPN